MNYSDKMNSLLNLIFNLTEQVLEERKKDKNFSSFGNLDYVLKRIDSFLINDLLWNRRSCVSFVFNNRVCINETFLNKQ